VKYRVRNKDGELEFASKQQLEEGVRTGFVEFNDDVLMEGETEWRKVSSLVKVEGARLAPGWLRAINLWVLAAASLGAFAFYSFLTEGYVGGGIATFILVNVIGRIVRDAAKKRDRR
jgi:hypothetical protein